MKKTFRLFIAVFHNKTALLRIITPAGTKQLKVTSTSENLSDGKITSGGISNEGWYSPLEGKFSVSATSYNTTTWPAAEAAGLVCLPAAGYRSGSSVEKVGISSYNYYWSSAPYPSDLSYAYAQNGVGYLRYSGFSVRLVKDVK